jgi:hypothetical protein
LIMRGLIILGLIVLVIAILWARSHRNPNGD